MLSNLKELRKGLKLTQSELAAKMDVTRRSIIRWENGQTKPSMKKVERLAEVLGCKVSDLGKPE